MELMNSFIVFDNVGSFLLWTVVVAELLSLAKNAIAFPSCVASPSRTDLLSWMDRMLEIYFWKTLSCFKYLSANAWHFLYRGICLSVWSTWWFLIHSVYPFLFGEIVPEVNHVQDQRCAPNDDMDLENESWQMEDFKVDNPSEEKGDSAKSKVGSGRGSGSGEIFFHRLRSGTVYGVSMSPCRSSDSDMILRERTQTHTKILGGEKKGETSNIFGSKMKFGKQTKNSEIVLRYGRPRSLLKASVPSESIRSLGYHARSGRAK